MADVEVPQVVHAEEAPADILSGDEAGITPEVASEVEKEPVKQAANGVKENVPPKRPGAGAAPVRRPGASAASSTKSAVWFSVPRNSELY